MSNISTHVLDTSNGTAAAGVGVWLEKLDEHQAWMRLTDAKTDADGRVKALLSGSLESGTYRLGFETGAYFAVRAIEAFFPRAVVEFVVRDAKRHHHVPLLLSPFGYSTYRGT